MRQAKGTKRAKPCLKLPHERDESPEVGKTLSPLIGQAEKDLEEGLVDTDNYTRLSEAARKSRTTIPRGR